MSHMHPTYEAVVSGLKRAVPIAEFLAAATTTTSWDDNAVAFLKGVLNNESLMQWFHDLICKHDDVVKKTGAERTGAIHAAIDGASLDIRKLLETLGFAWEQVKQYAPAVIRLVLTVIGLRG